MMEQIVLQKNGPIAELILERAPVNALNEELVNELYENLQRIEAIRSGLSVL